MALTGLQTIDRRLADGELKVAGSPEQVGVCG
jgi:hypothetical protein